MKRTGIKRKPPRAGVGDFSSKVRAAVALRSSGVCEARIVGVCTGTATAVHHRKLRRFGDHRAVNALHVDLNCHDYIHLHPAWARRHGLLLSQLDDPENVPPVPSAQP